MAGSNWQLALPVGVRAVHTACFGVQRHSPADASLRAAAVATEAIRQVLVHAGVAAVETFEVVAGHDMPGARVLVGVWADPQVARHGLASLDLTALYNSLGDWRHSVGLWREEFTTPATCLATAYTGADPLRRRPGLAALPNALATWVESAEPPPSGPASPPVMAEDLFDVAFDPALPRDVPIGYGEHITGRNLRDLVHLRAGCDWTECGTVELAMGELGLRRLVELGLGHLWGHPVGNGAYGLRQLSGLDAAQQPLAEGNFGCFMRSAADVARWQHEQAGHMTAFQRLLDQEGLPMHERRLRTHQEISTLAPGTARFEYVNCGPRTGVLRFLELERSRLPVRPDLR